MGERCVDVFLFLSDFKKENFGVASSTREKSSVSSRYIQHETVGITY
jgi:hypothetical protein